MPSDCSHFLPASGIVSGNDTGTGKKESPIYNFTNSPVYGGDHASLRTTHFQVVPRLSVVGWKTFPKASKRDEIG